jgi:hypothetical protein
MFISHTPTEKLEMDFKLGLPRLAEITIIVVSVLLAFAIQAWWEESEQDEDAERLLFGVFDEYRKAELEIVTAKKYHNLIQASVYRLFEIAESEERDPDEVDELLGTLIWYYGPQLRWASLSSLVQGGQMHLIENPKVREALTELWRFTSVLSLQEEESKDFYNLVLRPYLRENSYTIQLSMKESGRTFPGSSEVDSYVVQQPVEAPERSVPRSRQVTEWINRLPLSRSSDHTKLLDEIEFLNLLHEKLWIQFDGLSRINRFLAGTKDLPDILEAELR